MINVQPFKANVTARKTRQDYPGTIIGKETVICPSARIYAGVKIGKNCLVCSNVIIREGSVIGDNTLIANGVMLNYNVTIGNNVKVMDLSCITGGTIIENDVFISLGVITTNDNSMGKHEGTVCNPPIIRSGVRIGANATILPGIEIRENSIVGAGSVVTHDVPPNSTVMGIPAKVKK